MSEGSCLVDGCDEPAQVRGRCRPHYKAAWATENRARVRANQRRWYEANDAKVKAAAKAWRDRNPEQYADNQRRWREANTARIKAGQRRWYEEHRAGVIARVRAYGDAHPEWRDATAARWRAANADHLREQHRAWKRANPDKVNVATARRRARIKGAPVNDFTVADWHDMLRTFDHRCAYCGAGGKLEQEHMTPISRGGAHTKANIVPACVPCNRAKSTMTAEEFLQLAAG